MFVVVVWVFPLLYGCVVVVLCFGVICLVVFGWRVRVFCCRFAGFGVAWWVLLAIVFVAGFVSLFIGYGYSVLFRLVVVVASYCVFVVWVVVEFGCLRL